MTDYIKKVSGNIFHDYNLLKDNHHINIDFVGDIKNIKNNKELYFVKSCYDAHLRCHEGYYKNDILKCLCACIEFPETIDEYFKMIGGKSRNMVRKAKKNGYIVKRIMNYNKYIDDIYEINTSKNIRCGKEMTSSYLKKPTKTSDYISENKYVNFFRYGCFKDNKLVAYINPYICNNCLLINQILGHGAHLKFGIMNLLIYSICEDMILNFKNVKYWWYINWVSGGKKLQSFKKSMGFFPKMISLKNIYTTNFLSNDITKWNNTKSVSLESNILKVLNSNETTPGISYKIPIIPNQKYKYEIIYENYNDSKIILYGRYNYNDTQHTIFSHETTNSLIFTTPNECKIIEIYLLFRNPEKEQKILIKNIILNMIS